LWDSTAPPRIAAGAVRNPWKLRRRAQGLAVSNIFQVRLHMKMTSWFSRLSMRQTFPAMTWRIAGSAVAVVLLMTASAAVAQLPTPGTSLTIPEGYTAHHSVDMGGNVAGIRGSGAMYDTLVNLQSGPRVLGETLVMRALPGSKHSLVDYLKASGNGFGGDPNNLSTLSFSKDGIYDFTGSFRRDRQYFDYDLLGNPNIVPGSSIPIGPSATSTTSVAWPEVNQSPVMFNTVRRMTDTNLTLLPLSKVTFRMGYSRNTFEGPSLSPSYTIAKYDAVLEEYQRNSTDDFTGAIDWKPVEGTKLTFEEEIDHYKADSYFTLNPNSFLVQESDGTPAYLGNWDSQAPYGIGGCNKTSLTNSTTILNAPQIPGGMPVIDAACDVVTSYMRSQTTRIITPTETFRLLSTSIKNVVMNGDINFTKGNMNLPNYSENVQGLDGSIRSISYSGYASAHREVIAADYGITWQATNAFSLSDQANFSSIRQTGISNLPISTTLSTPSTAGSQTINYTGALTSGNANPLPHGINGTPTPNYFGQESLINNLTASWNGFSRASLSVTYRYSNRNIGQGVPHQGAIPLVLADPVNGTVAITENGGIFNAVVRPTNTLNLNGSVEVLYDDNVFTPVSPRQTKHYRVHALFKPKTWMTLSGAFNDLERHNNTNNNQATVAAGDASYEGPIDHVDHTRVISMAGTLSPNEHYGLDFNYAYNDVYTATNICYDNGAQNPATDTGLPGTASLNSTGQPNLCPGIFTRGSTTQLADWFGRDFMDAPTQYGTVALALSPVDKIHANIGYRVSSVNGTRFFNDARDVNGSLASTYESPYLSLAWTIHPALVLRADYNYYDYGEGGPSGPLDCSTSTSLTSTVVPCTSLSSPTGLTEPSSGLTAARNFHANNLTIGMHYEF
jgi:hypothetical protein